jgi:hypothetical protein
MGEQLLVSDARAGLKYAIRQVLGCSLAALSVHFLPEGLGQPPREHESSDLFQAGVSCDGPRTRNRGICGSLIR